jgi:L-alanine-DL-glutamate epimerase-like enolase superfamily enzyme
MRRAIERLEVRVCTLPTERPQTDGTAEWSEITMVVVEPCAAGLRGLGYSYIHAAAATVVREVLSPAVVGLDALAVPAAMSAMLRAARNHGRPGLVACAISAVDIALWDLKAKLLDIALADLLGAARLTVPAYASGGFTSSNLDQLARELEGYVASGHRRVKIKVGREPGRDLDRVRVAREAVGPEVELMVDANGAYTRAQARAMAERFARHDVVYFEEPVSSDDLDGLRGIRERAPAGMAIAAGEYGYDGWYFRAMLGAGAVDILQADATRALGVTGFLEANTLCAARSLPLSSHCAPAVHVHAGAAASRLVHLEHFRDHAQMERLLFDGAREVEHGNVSYDPARPGLGLELRRDEAARHAA